jgi:hypothetical protein
MNARDYQRRAEQYRPATQAELRTAVDEFAAQGLTPRDISSAIRLPLDAVINILFPEGTTL